MWGLKHPSRRSNSKVLIWMKSLIMDEVCFLLCKSLQPWHEDVWAHRFHAWIECIIIMSKKMSYYRWTHWGTYSVMMYYSTWVTSTRLVPWFVCEWMEYNWEELGLPMNWQCSMDEYIYMFVCTSSIPSFYVCVHSSSWWRVWPTMAIQKAFTQLFLPSIWMISYLP